MTNGIRYLQLTDNDHKDEIVKQEGRKFFGYIDGKWKRRGIDIGYFLPDAPEFEAYKVITEEEANTILGI